jgi:orotate phosphoribosyltransferase
MTPERLLGIFRETGALLQGHFVLRSGRHSRQYFQCAQVLRHPGLCSEICGALAEKVRGAGAQEVISPAMGGVLVGHEVARHLGLPHIFAEKQEGKLVVRRFEVVPGRRYLVVEDVVTTGSAVKEVLEIVRAAGAVPAGVACLVDRSGAHPPDLGVPLVSLLALVVETFPAEDLPSDLRGLPAVKPGSK